jgi:hypothetical protein
VLQRKSCYENKLFLAGMGHHKIQPQTAGFKMFLKLLNCLLSVNIEFEN